MEFWMSTLSGSIGAFVGVVGAFGVAKWQLDKTQKQNNTQFYLRFNEAQIYINYFNKGVEDILEITQSGERRLGRILLSRRDFLELKEHMEIAVRLINPEIEEKELEDFAVILMKINQNAPIVYYRELNDLFFAMAIIYNLLLEDCRYLVNDDLPKKIDIGFFSIISLNIPFMMKKFRYKYKKLKKELKI